MSFDLIRGSSNGLGFPLDASVEIQVPKERARTPGVS